MYEFISVCPLISRTAIKNIAHFLEDTEVNESTSLSFNNSVAFLHKPKGRFKGLEFYASENEVRMLVAWHGGKSTLFDELLNGLP